MIRELAQYVDNYKKISITAVDQRKPRNCIYEINGINSSARSNRYSSTEGLVSPFEIREDKVAHSLNIYSYLTNSVIAMACGMHTDKIPIFNIKYNQQPVLIGRLEKDASVFRAINSKFHMEFETDTEETVCCNAYRANPYKIYSRTGALLTRIKWSRDQIVFRWPGSWRVDILFFIVTCMLINFEEQTALPDYYVSQTEPRSIAPSVTKTKRRSYMQSTGRSAYGTQFEEGLIDISTFVRKQFRNATIH